jgi:hypothetical protein
MAEDLAQNETDDGAKGQQWAKTADLHTGDEPGEAEREEERAKEVEDNQPDGPWGQEQIDQIEEMDRLKRQVAEEDQARHSSTDFQVGGEEQNYLRGGVPAGVGFAAREETFAKIRKEEGLQEPEEADRDIEAAQRQREEAAKGSKGAKGKGAKANSGGGDEEDEDEDEEDDK